MKLQVLCVCALLCAVACRSLDEGRQGSIPSALDDVNSRAKRCVTCNFLCEEGEVKFMNRCMKCSDYEYLVEEPCPKQ